MTETSVIPTAEELLDYSHDAEECNACLALNDQCPYHAGVAVGVDWMAQHLARIAVEPEILNALAVKRSRKGAAA